MFRINRRTDYAVRVMLCLARQPAGTRLPTRTVQDEMLIPRPFLQRIIADLSKVGLIVTFAGPGGGLQLARAADAINLRQIWEAIEGQIMISDCLQDCGICPLDAGCPVRLHWGQLQADLIRQLESVSLAQLAQDANRFSPMPAVLFQEVKTAQNTAIEIGK